MTARANWCAAGALAIRTFSVFADRNLCVLSSLIALKLGELGRESHFNCLGIRRGELVSLGQDPPGPDRYAIGIRESCELGDELLAQRQRVFGSQHYPWQFDGPASSGVGRRSRPSCEGRSSSC